MTAILMVCLGNICRSPLAEGILKSKLPENHFFVDSAGTANYHIGRFPDVRSIEIANSYGIDISTQIARQFRTSDFDKFDYIYAMDYENYKDILKMASTAKEKGKVKCILSEVNGSDITNIPDPYYGGKQGFDKVYKLLDEACSTIANNLRLSKK